MDREFHHAAAKGYWGKGVDLGDMAILKDIPESCGLDWNELSQRLESGYYRERLLMGHRDAKDRDIGVALTYPRLRSKCFLAT